MFLSAIYCILETVLNLTEKFPKTSYIATFFDVVGCLYYCYFAGMNSFFFGALIYIVTICTLNQKTKQGELALFISVTIHLIILLLIFFKIIPYLNLLSSVKTTPNYFMLIFCWSVVSGVNFINYKIVKGIVLEKKKLLYSLLPEKIADVIENGDKYSAKRHDLATVVFIDFVNFTLKTQDLDPEKMVRILEDYFNTYDDILDKYNITKLKNIGDGYMFVSGVPDFSENMASTACFAVRDILNYTKKIEIENPISFGIRVGMATGEVVGAVVGKKRISYDIWSKTVNLASRIESASDYNTAYMCFQTAKTVHKIHKIESAKFVDLKGFGKIKIYKLE